MEITAAQIRAAYEALRACPPFDQWGLPPAEAVRFRAIPDIGTLGYCDEGCISISKSRISHFDRLAVVVAHEMVHLVQDIHDQPVGHGRGFQTLAREVCAELGFDPKEF